MLSELSKTELYAVWCMVYASSVHESNCFSTSRAPGSCTPSIIYFQPMKQTRADMLGVGVVYVWIRLIIPDPGIDTGRSEPCLGGLLAILFV